MGPKKKGKNQSSSPARVTRRGAAAAAVEAVETIKEEDSVTMEVDEETIMDIEEMVPPIEDLEEIQHEKTGEQEMIENEVKEEKLDDDADETNEEDHLEDEPNEEVQQQQETVDDEAMLEVEDIPAEEAGATQAIEMDAGIEEGVTAKTFIIGSPEAAPGGHSAAPDEDYSPIINAALAAKPPMDEITVEEKAAAVAEAAEAAVAEAVEAAVGDITQAVAETKPRSRKPRNKWSKDVSDGVFCEGCTGGPCGTHKSFGTFWLVWKWAGRPGTHETNNGTRFD